MALPAAGWAVGKAYLYASLAQTVNSKTIPVTWEINRPAETSEDVNMSLQATGRYDVIYMLTADICTRPQVLNVLVKETKTGRTIKRESR